MPEPPGPPEQVYRDAALALLGAQGYHLSRSTQHALAAGRQRDPGFRAAVKLAWTAGFGAGRNTDQIDVTPLDSAQRQILCNACGQIHHEPRETDEASAVCTCALKASGPSAYPSECRVHDRSAS